MSDRGAINIGGIMRERALWLLVLLVGAVFHRPLTTDTFFFRDLYLLFFPKRVDLARSIAEWRIPLWDPLSHGGQPFLASPANTSFYPTNLLYLVLEPVTAFNVSIVLQFVLAAVATYLLSRVLRFSPMAAFTAGTVFTLCGVTLSAANLLPLLLALPWAPLTVLCTIEFLRRGEGTWFVSAALCSSLLLFSGAAEVTAMTFLTLGVWVLFLKSSPYGRGARFGTVVILGIASIALSLIQTLPAVEMIRESTRGEGMPYQTFSSWSVHPARMPELVIPRFFGQTDTLSDADYWGRSRESEGFPYLLSIYFGPLTLILAGIGALRSRPESFPVRPMAALVVFGFVLSLGRFLPILPLLWKTVPFVSLFRYPIKALLMTILPISLLAGAGLDVLREESERFWNRTTRVIVVSGLTMSLFWILLLQPRSGAALASLFFGPGDRSAAPLLAGSVLHSTGVLIVAALLCFLNRGRRETVLLALAGLVAVDLSVAGLRVNAWAPRQLFARPSAARAVARLVGDGRFHFAKRVTPVNLAAPTNDLFWLARMNLESLHDYAAATYGIPVIFHSDYDGLAPKRVVALTRMLTSLPWSERIRVFEMAGVRAFATTETVSDSRAVLSFRFKTEEARPVNVYALPQVRMAKFVSAVIPGSDRVFTESQLRSLPHEAVFVRASAGSVGCGTAPVTTLMRSEGGAVYSVDAPCDGFIYLADTFYPGWKHRIDGRDITALEANYAFTVVPVRKGKHTLERTYEPVLFRWGLAGSFVALLVVCIAPMVWGSSRAERKTAIRGFRA